MKISFAKSPTQSDLYIVPFWEGPKPAADDSAVLKEMLDGFKGKNGETALYFQEGQKILLLGLGKQDEASIEALRRAYSAALRICSAKKFQEINLLFPKCKQKDEFIIGISEGLFLTNYSFTYKSDALKENPVSLVKKVTFVGVETTDLSQLQTIAKGVHFVRDLVNSNADDKIEQVITLAKKLHPKVKTTFFDKKELKAQGFGLILAVNRSSSIDPCLVQVSYKGDPKSKEHIVLVGKGVTYDTGGLSLKPTDGMVSMKCDMAGSATVLGAVKTAADLGLKVNVTALLPLTENCIGSKSYKLGDVYTSYSGKTVEINNTDAEGRLVLADALSYAVKHLKPSAMIDLATLTGACVVALGEEISGLFSNSDELADDLLESSERTDELIWRLPMHPDYKEKLKSDIADLINSPGRDAGSITAGLFLQEFVGDIPWAHIDIAGPAYVGKPKHYNTTKATGHGLRLLVDFLMSHSS